jgi:hypothetical protein
MIDDKKPENYAETAIKIVGTLAEKSIVPIYEDLAKPSLKQIGEGLGGFLSIAMMPLQMMGYQAEHWKNEFQKSLDRKASKIPNKNLQPPSPTVVGPIMQALGYTVHEENIREMFTNLLSAAMNSQTAFKAHPAFVEIIKQMSPDEARIIKYFKQKQKNVYLTGSSYSIDFLSTISKKSNCEFPENDSIYINNLERLGLIYRRTTTFWGSLDAALSGSENHENSVEAVEIYEEYRNSKLLDIDPKRFVYNTILLNDFGRSFLEICIEVQELNHE